MRFRRVTMRGLLVVIAVVAVTLEILRERHFRFKEMADHHFPTSGGSGVGDLGGIMLFDRSGQKIPDGESERFEREQGWHRLMYNKYKHAASRPWLPVLSDPAPDW